MRAALFKGKDYPLTIQEIKKPKPVKDQVRIRLHTAALNHRDLWIVREQAQHFPDGIALGSDGCGVVEDVGEDADPMLIGMEVIINPSLEWGVTPLYRAILLRYSAFLITARSAITSLSPRIYIRTPRAPELGRSRSHTVIRAYGVPRIVL